MSVRYPTSSIESRFVGHGLLAADAGSSRLVYAMVVALIVIGVVLIVLAIVVFRRTRVDLDVLAPLERMGSRKWRKGDPESRRQLLDAVRPAGATGPSLTESDDAPVGLPPPVIESDGEVPHDATFVAGPDGIEPVEHVEEPGRSRIRAGRGCRAGRGTPSRSKRHSPPTLLRNQPRQWNLPRPIRPRSLQTSPRTPCRPRRRRSGRGARLRRCRRHSDDAGGAQDEAVVVADEAISAPDDVPAAPERLMPRRRTHRTTTAHRPMTASSSRRCPSSRSMAR